MTRPISTLTYDKFIARLDQSDPFTIDPKSFEILSTIRYDPNLTATPPSTVAEVTKENFFLLPEHIERTRFSVEFFHSAAKSADSETPSFPFNINQQFIYDQLILALSESLVSLGEPLKIRLLVSLDGSVRLEMYATPRRENLLDGLDETYPELQRYDIYVDKTPLLVSPFTSFKTTKRQHYSDARERALPGKKPGLEEVILVSSSGEVTEGSITNIAIKNKTGEWITPQLTSGCLCGVTRHFLLKKNLIKEGNILLDSLKLGQDVLLLNAILGVVRGTIVGFTGK